MHETRRADFKDLAVVASWLRSAEECSLWAGSRVTFPIDLATLPGAIEWELSDSWALVADSRIAAFGQIVRKPHGRVHLARLVVAPESRGGGLGRLLAKHLLQSALALGPAAVSLNVALENAPALALYGSLGFAAASRPPDEGISTSVYMEHAA